MPNIYVRSTDGVNTDNGSTWALAKLDLVGAAAIDAAGDTIYVSQSHAESTATSITIALAGTAANPTKIICGNDAAEPPTAVSDTATATTTGATDITISGTAYFRGIGFVVGRLMSLCAGSTNSQIYELCNFATTDPGSAGGFVVTNSSALTRCVFKRCTFKFASAGNVFRSHHNFTIQGGGIDPTSASLTNFLRLGSGGQGGPVLIEGFDFSNFGAAFNIFGGNSVASVTAIVRNCKLPASWAGALLAASAPGIRAEMHNCDSADTNYRLWIEDYAGSIKSETTLVRTGGASDGTVPFSLKMTASANASYPLVPLESCELAATWNDTTGSAKTVTVEVLHDNITNLTDAEIWLEVQYLGTSGFPLSTFISDSKADVLATAADQAASTEAWTTTGMTNPNKQKLSVTFTPQEKGYFQAKVFLAKASTTVYVDPLLIVS